MDGSHRFAPALSLYLPYLPYLANQGMLPAVGSRSGRPATKHASGSQSRRTADIRAGRGICGVGWPWTRLTMVRFGLLTDRLSPPLRQSARGSIVCLPWSCPVSTLNQPARAHSLQNRCSPPQWERCTGGDRARCRTLPLFPQSLVLTQHYLFVSM
ncbi:hypothetical protein VTK73DRAFT_4848 [Phialemonium thermophilum]|uniref:Uncharacterized protein n=1 Tax=Phialemonium thermophilum TaxID=223376 RepID=A0ABR3V7D0_9PEZI